MILIILIIAIILRLVRLDQSLWLDEAINVNVAKALSLKDLVLNYSLSDFHPPLFHVVLRGWILMFGSSEMVVRLPSVIFGAATVFMTYLIGKKLLGNKSGLVAATLLATSPLHIYYSQEARMYMLAAFLTSLSVYFFISILERDTILRWLGFIISTCLLLYSDYLPYLIIPAYALYLAIFRKRIARGTLNSFLPAIILIFIFLIPWLLIFPRQLEGGLSVATASPAWSQVVGSPTLKNFVITFVKFTIGRISHDNNLVYALLFAPVGLFVSFLTLISLFRLSVARFILWFWLGIPIFLGFAIAFVVPIYAYFRFIFVLPAFYLILASGVTTLNWINLTRLLLGIAVVINLVATSIYFTNPKFQRENWKLATSFVNKNATSKTLVLFEFTHTLAPFDYYNKKRIEAFGALDSFNPNPTNVRETVEKLTTDKDTVYLFQYLSAITDPQGLVFQEISRLGFKNTITRDFEGVGFVYEFTH